MYTHNTTAHHALSPSRSRTQVPKLWSRVAYPSLKPLASWVKDYHARVAFMRTWLQEGVPKCFWLPGFFFPQVSVYFSCGGVHHEYHTEYVSNSPLPTKPPYTCVPNPGLFFISLLLLLPPQGFMTGVLQAHARKYSIPIDTLGFGFTVMEAKSASHVVEAPQVGGGGGRARVGG